MSEELQYTGDPNDPFGFEARKQKARKVLGDEIVDAILAMNDNQLERLEKWMEARKVQNGQPSKVG